MFLLRIWKSQPLLGLGLGKGLVIKASKFTKIAAEVEFWWCVSTAEDLGISAEITVLPQWIFS